MKGIDRVDSTRPDICDEYGGRGLHVCYDL